MSLTMEEAIDSRQFQRDGVDFIKKNMTVLVADEPGLGKTIQSIAAIVEADVKGLILVVAPKTAAYVTWPQELRKWTDEPITVIGGKLTPTIRKQRMTRLVKWSEKRPDKRGWVIITPNYLRMSIKTNANGNYVYDDKGRKIVKPVREGLIELLRIPWGGVIVDEAHQTLSGASGNVKKQSAQRKGLGLLKPRDGGIKIALSGTPARGKAHAIWGILNWLKPKEYTSYWSWVDKHFGIYNDGFGQYVGELKSEERLGNELRDIMIRRTKREVLAELPPKQYGGSPLNGVDGAPIAVWLEMEDKQEKAYQAMYKDAIVEFDNGNLVANGILAEMTRLKQFANAYGFIGADGLFYPQSPSNKLEWIMEFLEERGYTEDWGMSRCVIASQFTKLIDMYEREINAAGIPTFKLTGAASEDERKDMQWEFQNNPDSPRVFLLNTKAGGVSLTLDEADDVIIIDSTYSTADQEQVEDRAHRISKMHNVTVWYLATIGTIDETILKYTNKHELNIKRILDGQRGANYAKQLLEGTLVEDPTPTYVAKRA